MHDGISFTLKPEDSPADAAPALAHVETIQPRRVRTQLAAHRAELLGLQDDFERLLSHIPGHEGRQLWRRIHNALSVADERVGSITVAVERGA